jgi:magnesium transporter
MITIRTQDGNNFTEIPHFKHGCWVDARNVTGEDLKRLEQDFGVEAELLTDIMDTDEQSRIEYEDEYTALIVRLPVYDGSYEISCFTVPLGIVIFPDKIITVCQRTSEALDDISANRVRGLVFRNTSAFVLNMLGRAAFAFLKSLKELNKNANIIERQLQKSIRNNELIQLLSIQKSLVFFTTSIKTNELLLEKLKKSPLIRGNEEDEELLDDVMTENVQALEMANIYSSILTGTMDAFASVISNNMNIVMKRLAIINIVLMIPTLIYSFYGMNVPLPGQHWPFAVLAIILGSLVIAGLGVIVLSIEGSYKQINPPPKHKKHSIHPIHPTHRGKSIYHV